MERKLQRIRELLADALPQHCANCRGHAIHPPDPAAESQPVRRKILLSRIYWLATNYEMAALRDTYVAAARAATVDALTIDQLDTLANLLERSADRMPAPPGRQFGPR